jgi:hypothetical protein
MESASIQFMQRKHQRRLRQCWFVFKFNAMEVVVPDYTVLSPHLRTPNPGFNSGLTPPLLYSKCGGWAPRTGVWHPEMWALYNVYMVTCLVAKLKKLANWVACYEELGAHMLFHCIRNRIVTYMGVELCCEWIVRTTTFTLNPAHRIPGSDELN